MKKKTFIIILVVAIVVVLVAACIAVGVIKARDNSNSSDYPTVENVEVVETAAENQGGLPEKIIGNPATATVTVYEYADYACSHCASWNRIIEQYLEQYPDQIALVFRGYDIGFTNGRAAAKAATAAQAQGYWREYKNQLFTNQAEWSALKGDDLTNQLVAYFQTASNGQGDVNKFKADISSHSVINRVDAENQAAKDAGIQVTPTFIIDGENVPLSEVQQTIEDKINS